MSYLPKFIPVRGQGVLPVDNLALPGDSATVLDVVIRQAIRRDGRRNPRERHATNMARECWERREYRYGKREWPCNYEQPCYFCKELR